MLLVTWRAGSRQQVKMVMLRRRACSAEYCMSVSGLLTLFCYSNGGSLMNKTLFIILSRTVDEGRTVDVT